MSLKCCDGKLRVRRAQQKAARVRTDVDARAVEEERGGDGMHGSIAPAFVEEL
jgi:hypothetical protein